MTDDEFLVQLFTISPKIQTLLTEPNAKAIMSKVSPLAMTATDTSDLDSALGTLKADPAKLAALADRIAAQVAAVQPGPAPLSPQPALTPSASSPPGAPPAPPSPATQNTPAQQPPTPSPAGGQGGQSAAPQQALGGSSGSQLPWHPPKELIYVAPRVSYAVIAGFFVMLGVLLWQQTYPSPAPASDNTAKAAAAVAAAQAAGAADAAKQAADKKLADAKNAKQPDVAAIASAQKDADAAGVAGELLFRPYFLRISLPATILR